MPDNPLIHVLYLCDDILRGKQMCLILPIIVFFMHSSKAEGKSNSIWSVVDVEPEPTREFPDLKYTFLYYHIGELIKDLITIKDSYCHLKAKSDREKLECGTYLGFAEKAYDRTIVARELKAVYELSTYYLEELERAEEKSLHTVRMAICINVYSFATSAEAIHKAWCPTFSAKNREKAAYNRGIKRIEFMKTTTMMSLFEDCSKIKSEP